MLLPLPLRPSTALTRCTEYVKPVFHEGLKGWSCCKKRVTEFDEFMAIPGCTAGLHTSVAQAMPAPKKSANELAGAAMAASASSVPSVPPAAAAPAKPSSAAPAAPSAPAEPEDDPVGTVVAAGTACKRGGCTHKKQDDESDTGAEACRYHKGVPIFHEGSKGWSCCSRKVLEFSEFLKIQGCKTGRHRYLESAPADGAQAASSASESVVDCRFDWYQTQTHIIISFFAKKLNKGDSSIVFEDNKVNNTFEKINVYAELVSVVDGRQARV